MLRLLRAPEKAGHGGRRDGPGERCVRDDIAEAVEDLGDDAKDFFVALARQGARLCGYQARQILLLRERYASDDLALALRHAKGFGAFEHRAVARILEARATPRTLAEYVTEDAARRAVRALGRADPSATTQSM